MKRFLPLFAMLALLVPQNLPARAEFLVNLSLANHLPCPARYDPTTGFLTGTNPATNATWQFGDAYHLVFSTSTTTLATETGIGYYNAFVNTAANRAGSVVRGYGVAWRAIASTATVNAKDNAPVSAPVYRLDGVLVATGFADLWDGTIRASISVTETGLAFAPGSPCQVWTGSNGTGFSSNSLGFGHVQYASCGQRDEINGNWVTGSYFAKNNSYPLYGLSERLILWQPPPAVEPPPSVPEPPSLASLALALGVLLLYGYCKLCVRK